MNNPLSGEIQEIEEVFPHIVYITTKMELCSRNTHREYDQKIRDWINQRGPTDSDDLSLPRRSSWISIIEIHDTFDICTGEGCKLFRWDCLHLNPRGYEILNERLWFHLEELRKKPLDEGN